MKVYSFQVFYLSHSDNIVFYEHGNILFTGNINHLILILRAAKTIIFCSSVVAASEVTPLNKHIFTTNKNE